MAQIYDFDDFNYDAYSSEAYDIKEVGRRIKLARKARRMSQKDLADKLGRSLRTIQKYESGDIEVSITALVSLCQALNVPLSYLIGLGTRRALISSLADVMDFLFMLEKVSELKFDIGVEKPPKSMDWKCSLSFNGNGTDAKHNSALCLLLEQWRDQKDKLARGKITEKEYADWKDQTISYCSYERISQPENQVPLFSDKFSEEQQTALRELLDKYEERKKSLLETEAKLKELRNRDLRGRSD